MKKQVDKWIKKLVNKEVNWIVLYRYIERTNMDREGNEWTLLLKTSNKIFFSKISIASNLLSLVDFICSI